MNAASPSKARYIMIGGFLGAGKTTAVSRLAARLSARGLRVGLITNDQGANLADTALLRSRGFATEEIPGGCFCCRFNSLVEAARNLTASTRPEVFIAEPVGSCTDLAATVAYPLRRLYGAEFTLAPVSALLDPVRALRILGLEPGPAFSPKVAYIYKKQIEDADLVVLNKADLVDAARLECLRAALASAYPGKEIHTVSAREETGLDAWFDRLTRDEQTARNAMEVDYAVYAEGEALLGWLNATVQIAAPGGTFDADRLLAWLAAEIQRGLRTREAEVAHLKMTLSPDGGVGGGIASINLVRNDAVPELAFHLEDPVVSGQLIVNLRAEAAPEDLAAVLRAALALLPRTFPGLSAALEHLEHFRPGKPNPTHRIACLPGSRAFRPF
ncbi:MAG: GTP-binding protein [Chthoniobacteraceae bacterium]|nr:GTP-binding protein [Chthoniobacteraceae bacterium]